MTACRAMNLRVIIVACAREFDENGAEFNPLLGSSC
jgi:hypothetical protein